MNPRNLSEYYESIGERLPTVAERQSVAAQAGIDNYRGTATQNQQLLGYLTSQNVTSPGVAPVQGPVRPGETLDQPQINLGNVNPAMTLPGTIPTADLSTVPAPLTGTVVNPQREETEGDRFARLRGELETEIGDIEARMLARTDRRTTQLEEANVFEDMRALTELRSQLRAIEDRELEIPIEARQRLRGRGATITEFDQTTAPELESNLLRQLATSRQVSSLAELVQTNINIIDSQLEAERQRDELIYQQKANRLNQIETMYSNYMSDEQNRLLAQAKLDNDEMIARQEYLLKQKEDLIKAFRDEGDYETAQAILNAETIDEAYRVAQGRNTQIARGVMQDNANRAIGVIDQLEEILTDTGGMAWAVGRRAPWTRAGEAINPQGEFFISRVDTLLEDLTNEELIALKDRAGGIGAISDSERAGLSAAVIALGNRERGERFTITEKQFTDAMRGLQKAQKHAYIENMIGKEAYNQDTWRDASMAEIDTLYRNLRSQERQRQPSNDYLQNDFGVPAETVSFIMQEEGFSPVAYPDGGGYSIAYGNQTHPDGTPVRAGDRIDPSVAPIYLSSALQRHSNWKGLVNTPLSPLQQTALASFEYNLGPAIWSDPTANSIIARINSGDFNTAGQLMQRFTFSQGRQLPVLQQRRAREAQLLNNIA